MKLTFEIRQEQTFCWQSKAARRFIRERFKTNEALGCQAVYSALTEMASDQGGNAKGRWTREQIADKASVSATIAGRSMRLLGEVKLIIEITNRDGKGHLQTPTIIILTHSLSPQSPESKFQGQAFEIPQQMVELPLEAHNPDSKSLDQGFRGAKIEEVKTESLNKEPNTTPKNPAPSKHPGQDAFWEKAKKVWADAHGAVMVWPNRAGFQKGLTAALQKFGADELARRWENMVKDPYVRPSLPALLIDPDKFITRRTPPGGSNARGFNKPAADPSLRPTGGSVGD